MEGVEHGWDVTAQRRTWPFLIDASNLGATTLSASNVGTSNVGTTPFGARNLGVGNLGATTLNASNVGTTPFGATTFGANNVGTSNLGATTTPFGASNFGASDLGASKFGAGNFGSSNFGAGNLDANANNCTSVVCPKCGGGLCVSDTKAAGQVFLHNPPNPSCAKFRGTPDVAAEAKYLLLHALSKTRTLTVEALCHQCNTVSPASTPIWYDRFFDPLAPGAVLPPDYKDHGADILLMNGHRIASSISLQPTRREANLTQLEPHLTCAHVLSYLLRSNLTGVPGDGNTALSVREARGVGSCGEVGCMSMGELAVALGRYRRWTSDDVDWDSKTPDLSQYVANACTGKIRVYTEWRQGFPFQPTAVKRRKIAQNELIRRQKCIRCSAPAKVQVDQPFCQKCVKTISTGEGVLAYDTESMDPTVRQNRQKELAWIKSFPYVKKPIKEESSDLESAPPTPEKPCAVCDIEQYKPIFYYGYHALCANCLLSEYLKHQ